MPKKRKKCDDCPSPDADAIRREVVKELTPKDERKVRFMCEIRVIEMVESDPELLTRELGQGAYRTALRKLADGEIIGK